MCWCMVNRYRSNRDWRGGSFGRRRVWDVNLWGMVKECCKYLYDVGDINRRSVFGKCDVGV